MEDNRKLIPMGIKNCGKGKWLVSIDGKESYSVQGDIDNIRKGLLRIKAKNGDGESHCRSSKNGTYKSMISDEDFELHNINVWKSKVPHNAEEFKKLMEDTNNIVILSKPYIVEGKILEKGTQLKIVETISFLPTDKWNKAKELNGDERFDYIKKEVGDKYSDDEIKSFIKKNFKESIKEGKDITHFNDFVDVIEETLKSEKDTNHLNDDEIDEIIDRACENEKIVDKWERMESATDDKTFNKREQEFWQNIDNLVSSYKKENK